MKNGDVNADGFGRGIRSDLGVPAQRQLRRQAVPALRVTGRGTCSTTPTTSSSHPAAESWICEDDASSANVGQNDTSRFFGEDKNRLVGLTMRGTAFTFAENMLSESELAGACWSKDGEFLFVNIYGEDVAGSGGTMAITGPWETRSAVVPDPPRRAVAGAVPTFASAPGSHAIGWLLPPFLPGKLGHDQKTIVASSGSGRRPPVLPAAQPAPRARSWPAPDPVGT